MLRSMHADCNASADSSLHFTLQEYKLKIEPVCSRTQVYNIRTQSTLWMHLMHKAAVQRYTIDYACMFQNREYDTHIYHERLLVE